MTMEHVRDPKVAADAAFRLLRPGGAFVTVTRNYRSAVNRTLGRRSPIIDIEHMQLFPDKSIRYLFQTTGFESVTVNAFTNTNALSYWMRLSPIPSRSTKMAMRFTKWLVDDRWKLSFNVGTPWRWESSPPEAIEGASQHLSAVSHRRWCQYSFWIPCLQSRHTPWLASLAGAVGWNADRSGIQLPDYGRIRIP